MLLPMGSAGLQGELLNYWRELDGPGRDNLLLYAEFLLQRQQKEQPKPEVVTTPLPIPRPTEESAVKGLKRLKQTYPMIEADSALLGEASQLLMLKVTGTPDQEVIDRMEQLFKQRYAAWLEKRQQNPS